MYCKELNNPPASEGSRGVYWNKAKKIHPPVYWVPLGVCHSVTLELFDSWGPWNLPHKFHLYLILIIFVSMGVVYDVAVDDGVDYFEPKLFRKIILCSKEIL